MGLSIYYSGSFRNNASLSKMIDEVKDVVQAREWEYHIFEEEFPADPNFENSYNENIYGINFTPPECETVSLCFLSNKRMSDPVNLKFYGNSSDKQDQKYLYMLSVKTQFAGVEIHIFIIELFQYLQKQGYLENLVVIDDGKYWETGDENLLKQTFKRYVDLVGGFEFALEQVPQKKDESFEEYLKRLALMVQNKQRN